MTQPPKGVNADSAEMIIARDRFLSAGHYRPLADELTQAVADLPAGAAILEAGAGTGYYLGQVVRALDGVRGIATDLSAAACRRAARVDDRIGAVVADTWAGLPIKDAAVELIMVVFAPRNAGEFARLLRPGGRLLIATANDDHLVQVRDRLGLIDVRPGKLQVLEQSLQEWFDLQHSKEFRSNLRLGPTALEDLVRMGPSAHHQRPDLTMRIAAMPRPTTVTMSVRLSIFRRR